MTHATRTVPGGRRPGWAGRALGAGLACLFALALVGLNAAGLVAGESLAGRLLVATETMGDPRFRETVIYMVEHDSSGALGLIVNVPMGQVPVASLLEGLGLETKDAEGSVPVHYGGPVERGRGFVLHTPDVMLEDSVQVAEDVALTTRPEMLRAMAGGQGPKHSLFALGYAGWGPGQLESELAQDAWFVIPAEDSLVFSDDPATSWKRAVARRGIEL